MSLEYFAALRKIFTQTEGTTDACLPARHSTARARVRLLVSFFFFPRAAQHNTYMSVALLPRSILPLLLAAALAAAIMHFVRTYLCPSEDAEDRRRMMREGVLCFLAAALACLLWHVIGPFADHWSYLQGIGGGAAVAGGGAAAAMMASPPVDASIPNW